MGLEQHFFEIDGLLISEGSSIYSGKDIPSNLDLPCGSIYMRTTGEIWYKNSSLTWSLLTSNNVVLQEELVDYNEKGEPDILFDDDGDTYIREEV